MSLASLKKPARSPKGQFDRSAHAIDVDAFIDDALVYASGGNSSLSTNIIALNSHRITTSNQSPLRRATFTLGEVAIQQLNSLANTMDMPKSKILRLLIAEYYATAQK